MNEQCLVLVGSNSDSRKQTMIGPFRDFDHARDWSQQYLQNMEWHIKQTIPITTFERVHEILLEKLRATTKQD